MGLSSLAARSGARLALTLLAAGAPLLLACSEQDAKPRSRLGPLDDPWDHGVRLPEAPQLEGDEVAGRDTLLHGNYMSCGIPWRLWTDPNLGSTFQAALGSSREPLAGRTGNNADLPYNLTAFTAADGTEVVNANCLTCHASKFDGELILGLGDPTVDFTGGLGGGPAVSAALLDLLGLNDSEREHMEKVLRIANIIGPETVMRTVGNNPAEALAIVLSLHHDRDTLAWSDERLMELIVRDEHGQPIADPKLTSDPPPWWRSGKKNALFYNGMARGDHRGTMAYATSICVDDVAEAKRVDGLFVDIQAFLRSLEAPKYPRGIDADLADTGRQLFPRDCAGCHGKYGADGGEDAYPNLLFPLDVIGTDPVVANGGVIHAPELVDWYNDSFYGTITPMVPNDPFPGYVAPPLDGVWATAPFLHNGSVPTIELVLDSTARPKYWKRVDYDSSNFDEDALGWPWLGVPYGQADAPEAERKFIYDTTQWSQSNAGHTFGDHLSFDERRAVIEYLKTL